MGEGLDDFELLSISDIPKPTNLAAIAEPRLSPCGLVRKGLNQDLSCLLSPPVLLLWVKAGGLSSGLAGIRLKGTEGSSVCGANLCEQLLPKKEVSAMESKAKTGLNRC